MNLISVTQGSVTFQCVPLATNMASAEAVIHLMAEHPEALSGHHIAAEYLESIAREHD